MNPTHKIWRILDLYQKKQKKIDINQEAKLAHQSALLSKKAKKKEEERLNEQRGEMVAKLGILIDDYWKQRLKDSKEHKKKSAFKVLMEDEEYDIEETTVFEQSQLM